MHIHSNTASSLYAQKTAQNNSATATDNVFELFVKQADAKQTTKLSQNSTSMPSSTEDFMTAIDHDLAPDMAATLKGTPPQGMVDATKSGEAISKLAVMAQQQIGKDFAEFFAQAGISNTPPVTFTADTRYITVMSDTKITVQGTPEQIEKADAYLAQNPDVAKRVRTALALQQQANFMREGEATMEVTKKIMIEKGSGAWQQFYKAYEQYQLPKASFTFGEDGLQTLVAGLSAEERSAQHTTMLQNIASSLGVSITADEMHASDIPLTSGTFYSGSGNVTDTDTDTDTETDTSKFSIPEKYQEWRNSLPVDDIGKEYLDGLNATKDALMEVLSKASDTSAQNDPQAFLKSLSAEELKALQTLHSLADPINPNTVSKEGAYNLIRLPNETQDTNHDGMTTVGAAHTLVFPPRNASPSVIDAWNRATENMDWGMKMTMQLSAWVNINGGVDFQEGKTAAFYSENYDWKTMAQNLVTHAKNNIAHQTTPEQKAYAQAMLKGYQDFLEYLL